MSSRRDVLTSTVAAGAGLALASQGSEPAGARFEGAHHRGFASPSLACEHAAASLARRWHRASAHPRGRSRTTNFLLRMDEAGVDRAVIVPPSWPGDRNDYAIEAMPRYPTRFRIMGKFPLQDPKGAARLATWKQQPGMVGLRVIFNTPQSQPWLTDGTVDWLWAAAEKAELRSCASRRRGPRCSDPWRSAIRACNSSSTTWASVPAWCATTRSPRALPRRSRSRNTPT